MARKYSKKASTDVERVMKKRKAGTLKSGRSGRKVTSRKQAIAIGLSEARAKGRKVPKKASKKRKACEEKDGEEVEAVGEAGRAPSLPRSAKRMPSHSAACEPDGFGFVAALRNRGAICLAFVAQ